MNNKNLSFFLLLFAGAIAGCNSSVGVPADVQSRSNSTASSNNSASNSGAAAFTGKNGRVSVNGDIVQAKDGTLTVNGIPYGTVDEKSSVKYTVRDNERVLSVDGVVRKPAR